MKRLALFGLLLLGVFQAARGSARHLSEFGVESQVDQLDSAWWLLPVSTPNPLSSHSRALKQIQGNPCPIPGCEPLLCQLVQNGAEPGYKCGGCQNTLLLKDNACVCPAGRYGTYLTCVDCPKGSWCPGGKYTGVPDTVTGQHFPDKIDCPTIGTFRMTTLGTRSTSKAKCVNPAGTRYTLSDQGEPGVEPCPEHFYGPGLKKQRACVPCPSGYTTEKVVDGVITAQSGQALKSACVVPEGYFSKSPGVIARCPPGEYKSGLGGRASCDKCLDHVTTEHDGAKSAAECTWVVATYFAKFDGDGAISGTELCPRGHYCPGGNTAHSRRRNLLVQDPLQAECPAGTYTENPGASSADECLVPPGFYYDLETTSMKVCPDGTYRAEWRIRESAHQDKCIACGEGISAQATEQVMLPDPPNNVNGDPAVTLVRASAASCYIKPGQGMLKLPSGNFKAFWCDNNNYGVAGPTFGLQAFPCTACPYNMVTKKPTAFPYPPSNEPPFYSDADNVVDGDGGFTDPKACVTQVGYGYNGRISYKCPRGWYNAGNNRDACTQCPYGRTTLDDAAKQASEEDCGIAPGFGFFDGAIVPCPIGTYNDQFRLVRTTPCTNCPYFTSTFQTGGLTVADCNVCQAGYGHDPNQPPRTFSDPTHAPLVEDNCMKECGTIGTYGTAGRKIGTLCDTCPEIKPGFYFAWASLNHPYMPAVVAPPRADALGDCLAEFGQVGDMGAWYVGGAAPMVLGPDASTLEACAALCKANDDCEYVTFDYKTTDAAKKCFMKINSEADQQYAGIGGEVMAYKAVLAGDTGAASAKNAKDNTNKVKSALSSGRYSFYWESSVPIGTPSQAVDFKTGTTPWTFKECLDACDAEGECLAAGMTKVTKAATDAAQEAVEIGSCRLVKGVMTAGVGNRSVTKVDLERLSLPAAPDKVCTAGSECGTGACTPVNPGGWSTCSCTALGKQWDPVARDCVEYTPVLLDDRRLMIFQLGKNYRDAYAFCKNDVNKATLATLNNPTETQRLLAIGPVNTVQALWIGLTNTLPPDSTWLPAATDRVEWKWISTGKPPEWDHWSNQLPPPEAEPNDWVNSEGSCAAVYSALVDERPDGFWNDYPCNDEKWFVCEK